MTIRANFTKSYLRRYLWLAAIGIGWAAWCAYDGLVAYPRQLEISIEYEKLGRLPAGEVASRWRQITAERGWSDEIPRKAEELQHAIDQQKLMGALGILLGLPALGFYFRSRGSWVELIDDGGLRTSWGQTVRFSDVQRLDKARWAKKGIAVARYVDDGRTRTFVFDDFKFEPQPLANILRKLEQTLPPAAIVGGPPESTSAESNSTATGDKAAATDS